MQLNFYRGIAEVDVSGKGVKMAGALKGKIAVKGEETG